MPKLTTIGSVRPAWQEMFLSAGQVNALAGEILAARRAFLAAGDPATALRIAEIYSVLNSSLNEVARAAAALSEVGIRKHLALRPSGRPSTRRPGVRLGETIHSEWTKGAGGAPALAYVGIGIIEELDKAVNPHSASRKPYWKVQEYGFAYTHVPEGFFFGPNYSGTPSRPSVSQSGVHPLFIPTAKGRAFQSPPVVPARHFLRDGSADAVKFWVAGVNTASNRAAKALLGLGGLRGIGRGVKR